MFTSAPRSPSEVLSSARRNGHTSLTTPSGVVRVEHDQSTQTYAISGGNRPTMRGLAYEIQAILANLSSFL